MGSRRGRSLIGRTAQTAARTAVIAGTATAVSGRVAARQAAVGAAGANAAAAPVSPGLTEEAMAQLQKLGELRASGVLTEEEFAAQKASILG